MNSSDLLLRFRSEMSDKVAPYLWDDTEVFGYMDEAQTEFCRKTNGLADSRTVAVTQLSVTPGNEWYTLSSLVLQVREATRGDTGRPLRVLTTEQFRAQNQYFMPAQSGPLLGFVTGLETHAVRSFPIPNETVTVNLSVYRLPLLPITDAGDEAFEIDSQHHVNLLLWMKHRAYDKQDSETADRRKSDEYRQRFEEYCASVKLEQERARRAPGTVAYGGI